MRHTGKKAGDMNCQGFDDTCHGSDVKGRNQKTYQKTGGFPVQISGSTGTFNKFAHC